MLTAERKDSDCSVLHGSHSYIKLSHASSLCISTKDRHESDTAHH